MLREPTRINAYLSDIALKGYRFAERIFANGGGVSAVRWSTQLTSNDLLPNRGDRRSRRVLSSPRSPSTGPGPRPRRSRSSVASSASPMRPGPQRSVADPVRGHQAGQRRAAMAARPRTGRARGQHHRRRRRRAAVGVVGLVADATTATISTETKAIMPAATLAKVRQRGQTQELGADYNLLVLNPQEFANLSIIYGDAEAWLRAGLLGGGVQRRRRGHWVRGAGGHRRAGPLRAAAQDGHLPRRLDRVDDRTDVDPAGVRGDQPPTTCSS